MMIRLVAMTALALCQAAPAAAQAVGETLHYLRSNRDGSSPEHIYVHRPAATRLAVYKMVARCTRAALVTATIDPVTGQASRLEAAGLKPGARSERYGVMRYDAARRRIVADVTMDAPVHAEVAVGTTPWHLYDYDLATLSVAGAAIVRARAARFGFGMALVWVDPERPKEFLRWIGAADARLVRPERHLGVQSLRYAVSGPAFGAAGGGPLWLDARRGNIVDVQWGRPNHAENADFRLRLIGREPAGARAWTALLRRHFAGCPAG